MKYVDGDKLTKNEIMNRLDKLGVSYDKKITSKQYYIELYNEQMKLKDKASTGEDKEGKQPMQSAQGVENKDTCDNTHSRQHQLQHNTNNQQQPQRKKGRITFSTILLAMVLALLFTSMKAQRNNEFSLLKQYPTIDKYVHQINLPVKTVTLSLINTIKPYLPQKLNLTVIDLEAKILNDDIIVIIPVFIISLFLLTLVKCLLC